MAVKRYRKKPVVVEAIQWDGTNFNEISDFMSAGIDPHYIPSTAKVLHIDTLEGLMNVHVGSWIIKGTRGEFYPCRSDVFGDSYEPVSD